MTLKEKILYQQIHPLKLLVDFCTGFYCCYLLWQHHIFLFLLLFLFPSVIVTFLLVRFASLENLKSSAFGRYVKKHMTTVVEAIRLVGQIIIWLGGWYHQAIIILVGFLVILAGWCKGLYRKGF